MHHDINEIEAKEMKVIHDEVHGSIRVDKGFQRLLSTLEMQRLAGIRQLGLGFLVFPGANHTRLEHSLGTYHIAGLMADSIGLNADEKRELMASALLHDIGHGPFSHTLEVAFQSKNGNDHMDITQRMIIGEISLEVDGLEGSIPDALESMGIEPEDVAKHVKKPHDGEWVWDRKDNGDAISSIISGPIDADQIDYLMRDAHYTGVAHGTIDLDRFLETILVRDGMLVVERGGVPAVEGMLVARALMYSSVYFHRTVRIAEMMLNRAVEELEMPVNEIQMMNDCHLISALESAGGYPEEIAKRIMYRRLYKRALSLELASMGEEERKAVAEWSGRSRELERAIAHRSGIDEKEVLVDIPGKDILISEPRMNETEVLVWDGSGMKRLSDYSTLPGALRRRNVHRWGILVAAPEEHREKVEKAARYVIFD
jgi:HD superfamily phosphohydrolase